MTVPRWQIPSQILTVTVTAYCRLAGAAREYAESPEPLTPEARRAGEEALARLRAKQAQRGGQAADDGTSRAAKG